MGRAVNCHQFALRSKPAGSGKGWLIPTCGIWEGVADPNLWDLGWAADPRGVWTLEMLSRVLREHDLTGRRCSGFRETEEERGKWRAEEEAQISLWDPGGILLLASPSLPPPLLSSSLRPGQSFLLEVPGPFAK